MSEEERYKFKRGYIVSPCSKPQVFVWHHDTESGAVKEAKKIADETRADVYVARIIGRIDSNPQYKYLRHTRSTDFAFPENEKEES